MILLYIWIVESFIQCIDGDLERIKLDIEIARRNKTDFLAFKGGNTFHRADEMNHTTKTTPDTQMLKSTRNDGYSQEN